MRESGRYKLFAEGNLGKGDFNVYRMFVELALFLVKDGGRAAQFVPENLYNGANATAIRRHLFEKCSLCALIGFENTKKVWFDIDSRAKFCLYASTPNAHTENFPAAFGINTVEKLLALQGKLPFDIPVSLVKEFSPEALAIAEVAHPHDIAISRKLYCRSALLKPIPYPPTSRRYVTALWPSRLRNLCPRPAGKFFTPGKTNGGQKFLQKISGKTCACTRITWRLDSDTSAAKQTNVCITVR